MAVPGIACEPWKNAVLLTPHTTCLLSKQEKGKRYVNQFSIDLIILLPKQVPAGYLAQGCVPVATRGPQHTEQSAPFGSSS